MKPNFKEIYEDYLDLKETIRSQGYTVNVEEKLIKFDKELGGFEKELREIRREKEHWNKNFEGGHEFNKGQMHIINRILGVDSDKKEVKQK